MSEVVLSNPAVRGSLFDLFFAVFCVVVIQAARQTVDIHSTCHSAPWLQAALQAVWQLQSRLANVALDVDSTSDSKSV